MALIRRRTSREDLSRRDLLIGAGLVAVGGAVGAVVADPAKSYSETAAEVPATDASAAKYPNWLGDPPVIGDDKIANTVTVDIVVVGGGNAGSMCAMAAAEKGGVTVAVLESQAKDKISYYGLHDIGHLNSQYCLNHGIPKIKVGEFVAEWQRRTNNRSDPRLIKLFAENSGELVDWLLANAPKDVLDGVTIITGLDDKARQTNKRYFELGAEINKYHCFHGSINMNYNKAAPTYIARAEKQGATWYWEHKGVVLITETSQVTEKTESWDENGKLVMKDASVPRTRVKGVIAKNAKGEYIKFLAKKAVVLSGGGYGGNREMYRALQDEQRETWESRGLDTSNMRTSGFGRDGSVIKMGLWAGGYVDPGSRILLDPQVMFSASEWKLPRNICIWGGASGGTAPQIWVDSKGKRFHDEAFMGVYGSVFRTDRMKSQRFFGFFDYGHFEELRSRAAPEHFAGSMGSLETLKSWVERGALGASSQGGPGGGSRGGGGNPGGTGGPGAGPGGGGSNPGGAGGSSAGPGGGGQAQKGQPVTAWGAKTLDELFTYMGFDDTMKATVKAEIERYNAFCEKGGDDDFGKDPKMLLPINQGPFFGVFCMPEHPMTGTVTLSGLMVNEDQAVIDKNYNPVVNLFAVGNSSGGKFSNYYVTPMQGLTLGLAMTLGRVLGKQLVVA
jgi:hypothetical protein